MYHSFRLLGLTEIIVCVLHIIFNLTLLILFQSYFHGKYNKNTYDKSSIGSSPPPIIPKSLVPRM